MGRQSPSRVRIPPSPPHAATLNGRFAAPVAQLDRASVYGTEGQRFESSRARSPAYDRRVKPKELTKAGYEKELQHLQAELVRLQEWIVAEGLKIVVLFEGRDTAGKGGV